MNQSCKLCGNQLNAEEVIKNFDGHGACVCDGCSMKVANAYEDWHGGCERWIGTKSSNNRSSEVSGRKRWEIFKRDGYSCVSCGSDSDLTIDHKHPKSNGGTNDESNLRTMCRSCNSSKGARVK